MSSTTEILTLEQQGRRGSKLIGEFIKDVTTRRTDTQLSQCIEGVLREEKELQLDGQLMHFYEEDEFNQIPDSADIEVQYKLLNDQYSEFVQHLLKKEEKSKENNTIEKKRWGKLKNIGRSSKNDQKPSTEVVVKPTGPPQDDPATDYPPTIEGVKQVVFYAQEKWKTKPRMCNGKVQANFHKFCGTLDGHKTLASMIPDQNEYFSLFCAGVKTLIKASVNHVKIAEDLAEALVRLSGDIDRCVKTVQIWPLSDVKKMVGELYSYIFHFLRCAMKWYQSRSWKKVLDSLNENFLKSFQNTLESIELLKTRIHQDTSLKSQAQTQDIHSLLKEMARKQREERLFQRQQWYSLEKKIGNEIFLKLSRQIGLEFKSMLESNFQASLQLTVPNVPEGHNLNLKARSVQAKSPKQITISPKKTYTRETLQKWSRSLEINMTNIADLMITTDASTDGEVATVLEEWSRVPISKTLWIRGHDEISYPSSNSKVAATVAAQASQAGIPLLGFFCDCRDPREDPTKDKYISKTERAAFKETVVINLIYSLIRQVISILPNRIETRTKFSKAAFSKLDGTLYTWDDALKILKRLMKLMPRVVLVVIDGVEQLDQSDNGEYVDDILSLLLSYIDNDEGGDGRIFKILFTTAGACSALEKYDDVARDMVTPSQVRAKRVHGRGRRILSAF